jgi:hypothetical protein
MKFFLILTTLLATCFFSVNAFATEAVSTLNKEVVNKATTTAKKEATKNMKGGKGSRSRAMFKNIDTDGNGTISEAEFTNVNIKRFKNKDKNKDGMLSKEEFSPLLKGN